MPIFSKLSRIASTCMAMLHTRLDLMSVEIEEEVLRFASYFICTLIILFCGGVAVLAILALILVLFWEQHRITVLLSMIAIFGASSVVLFVWLKTQIVNKPGLLAQTIAEFKRDIELLRVSESESEQQSGQGLS